MISVIEGVVHEMEDDGALVVGVGVVVAAAGFGPRMASAVGFRVVVSDRDRSTIRGRKREIERLLIRAIYREGEPTLFGFLDVADRVVFDRICNVDGCGPSTALKILSKVPAADFWLAITRGDATPLAIVGPKTRVKLLDLVKLPDGMSRTWKS